MKTDIMTPKEFEIKMKELQYNDGDELVMYNTHHQADELLCEILKSLGYEDGIKIYEESGMWYE
jgi:hypothetical protein